MSAVNLSIISWFSMGWQPRWPMGHGSHGSWVTWVMGQELSGSLESWVTLSDPLPALHQRQRQDRRDNGPLP